MSDNKGVNVEDKIRNSEVGRGSVGSVVEVEISEDDIVGYLLDEEDREIGLIYKDDAGAEHELFYDGEDVEIERVDEGAFAAGGTAGTGKSSADASVGAADGAAAAAGNAGTAAGSTDDAQATEVIEIPDNVEYYMVTPEGIEIGFVTLDGSGEKQEFLYPKDAQNTFFLLAEARAQLNRATSVKGAAGSLVSTGANTVGGVVNKVAGKQVVNTEKISQKMGVQTSAGAKAQKKEDSDAVTQEDLKDMFGTFKEVAIEGYTALSGVLDQVDDVRDQIDEINPKKRRARRRAERATERANERAAKREAQKAAEESAETAASGEAAASASGGASAPATSSADATPAAASAPASASEHAKTSAPSDASATSAPSTSGRVIENKGNLDSFEVVEVKKADTTAAPSAQTQAPQSSAEAHAKTNTEA